MKDGNAHVERGTCRFGRYGNNQAEQPHESCTGSEDSVERWIHKLSCRSSLVGIGGRLRTLDKGQDDFFKVFALIGSRYRRFAVCMIFVAIANEVALNFTDSFQILGGLVSLRASLHPIHTGSTCGNVFFQIVGSIH